MARAIPARLARDDEDIELVEPQHDLFGHARRDDVERGIRAEILERHDDDARPLGALRLAEGLERAVGFAQRRVLPGDDADGTEEHGDQRERDAPPRRSAGAALGHGLGRGRRHAHRLRARIHEVILDGVAAARQLDPDGIAFAFARVVLDQAPAQATRLDAHQRIGLRVEVSGPAEHLDADRVTLQPLPVAGQRLFGDEAQEMRRAVRLLKVATCENPLELRAHRARTRLQSIVGARSYGLVARSTVGHSPPKLRPGLSIAPKRHDGSLALRYTSRSSRRRLECKGWT